MVLMLVLISATAEEGGYIKINDYGEEVIALHRKLGELGYYALRPESPWGSMSVAAVKILQENQDMPITGIVESKKQMDDILAIGSVIGQNFAIGFKCFK